MRNKPLIGLNADFRGATKDGPAFTYVSAGYYDAIVAVGGIPVVMPPMADEDDLERILEMLDGVVMVGGADLDPRRDGFMLHPTRAAAGSPPRGFRSPAHPHCRRAAHAAVRHRRRHAVAQRLARRQLVPPHPRGHAQGLPHKDPLDPAHRHGLEVVPGTIMERVYGEGEIRVNSMHHMACDAIAPGFMVSARCPDGVVEAIESVRDDWFAIGTQFHPESDSASALDLRIFEEFIVGITGVEAPVLKLVA